MQQNEKEILSASIITVDGPAGSGKSTVARLLAKKLGFTYIDTGAMYRALTLKALRNNIDLNDEGRLSLLAADTSLDITNDSSGSLKVFLDNENVASLIRTPKLTNNVSYVAKVAGVRDRMKENQRRIGRRGRCVLEGRDIGTVVFPDAKHKFYLDAEFDERVKRRFEELLKDGYKLTPEEIAKDLKLRDRKDMNRDIAPLKKAEDAVYIDTTNMKITEVVNKLASYIE